MNKNRIRLTESQLHRVIKESVGRILREGANVQNRVPFPLDNIDYVDDESGKVLTIPKDKFADAYNAPDANKKRLFRRKKNSEPLIRLWLAWNEDDKNKAIFILKNHYDELEQFGKCCCLNTYKNHEPEGKRIGVHNDIELWELDEDDYRFIIRKGKEKEWEKIGR